MSQITKPNTFTAQTKILSAQVNANFDTLYTQVNSQDTQIGNLSVFISLKSYGCKGDGVTDDSAKIQQALNDAAGKTLFIPTPATNYFIGTTTLVVKGSGTRIIFESNYAAIKYTGNGDAIIFPNSQYNSMEHGTIDISAAGANAVAIHMAGQWYGTIYKPTIVKGGANQVGILLETTATGYAGGTNYGSYLNRIIEPKITGTGLYDIQTKQTTGDTVANTHLTIEGGWISGGSSGIYLEWVQSGYIRKVTPEGGNPTSGNAIYLGANCYVIYVDELGEMDTYAHGITVNGANNVYIVGDNPNGNVSDVNIVSGTVNQYGKNVVRMNPSPNYSVRMRSDVVYAQAFALTVAGGGAEVDILRWGDNAGLGLNGGAQPVYLINDFDAKQHKLLNAVIHNGATGSRPANPVVGQMYYDTTLSKPIWCKVGGGTPTWTDATGATV